MHNWFECKISYDKVTEDGFSKKVTEPYLVDALSFTEAEARIIEKMRPYISGEFIVNDIKRAHFYETFLNDTGDIYYRIKINLITLDEKTGAEKKTSATILVQASSIHDAISSVDNMMKSTMNDYVISSVAETALIDVFPFEVVVRIPKDENDAAE
ncbi:MAG: DUF4494 domain-containing protein [Tannerella sp.]|jgi:hypothetical protein|nr:DUF4494 domain-containing protein [Tannerella sp.]